MDATWQLLRRHLYPAAVHIFPVQVSAPALEQG
jgi:hypothetical protein